MQRFVAFLALTSALSLASCEPRADPFKIARDKDLKAGGVYVSYNLGCESGCDKVEKGDLIQKIDGKPVKTGADFDAANVMDGKPHKLEILSAVTMAPKTVEITATPKTNLPPLEKVPPFWTVGAEQLNAAPDWARRRMFGHASPMVQLISINGGTLDGRQLYGKKRLVVAWDWGDRQEESYAVSFMQVLQKAQADLAAKGVEIMFAHVLFPTGRKQPMNDTDLRAWADKWTVKDGGQKLPMIPFYRQPNKVEFNEARELGMENAYTMMENLGQSPAILLLDERGIVRWHSEGLQTPTADEKIQKPDQFTIIEAVEYARDKL
ncbi:MAG: hypothetical protein IAG13_05785 [Deltaproteobacteria bacterium]|nr:hypothetical protein [Nannocystaceae bacterium]